MSVHGCAANLHSKSSLRQTQLLTKALTNEQVQSIACLYERMQTMRQRTSCRRSESRSWSSTSTTGPCEDGGVGVDSASTEPTAPEDVDVGSTCSSGTPLGTAVPRSVTMLLRDDVGVGAQWPCLGSSSVSPGMSEPHVSSVCNYTHTFINHGQPRHRTSSAQTQTHTRTHIERCTLWVDITTGSATRCII